MKQPRGLRNNNPGNIRNSSTVWVGEMVPSQDKLFKQFRSPAYGYRAMIKLLQNYSRLHRCHTLRQMIGRYAPPVENHTEAYLGLVAKKTGMLPDARVAIGDRESMCGLVAAMSFVENGVPARMEEVFAGWELL